MKGTGAGMYIPSSSTVMDEKARIRHSMPRPVNERDARTYVFSPNGIGGRARIRHALPRLVAFNYKDTSIFAYSSRYHDCLRNDWRRSKPFNGVEIKKSQCMFVTRSADIWI